LTFDADSQLLEGGFFSRVFKKALDQVLLKGFKLPELSLSRFTFRCSENIKNKDDKEFIGVTIIITINNTNYKLPILFLIVCTLFKIEL